MPREQYNKPTKELIDILKTYFFAKKSMTTKSFQLDENDEQLLDKMHKAITSQVERFSSQTNYNANDIKQIINCIKDRDIDIYVLAMILKEFALFQAKIEKKGKLSKLNYALSEISNGIFGASQSYNLITEIERLGLTLISYKTKNGKKIRLCSKKDLDKTLSEILPTITHGPNVKINNCMYQAGGYYNFCKKYILKPGKYINNYDITIIPSISHNPVNQFFTSKDAKRQYKNIYEKIFKFFNKKNVPISLLQTSACKGNNFAFALNDEIIDDVKINELELSTLNVLNSMLLPNYHSKYAETVAQCFYKKNINTLKVKFTYPTPEEIPLHALPGSIGYAEETIAKILEKANNIKKTEKISILKKILDSFDNTINVVLQTKNDEKKNDEKENCFAKNFCKSVNSIFFRKKFTVNNKQFLEQLKEIKQEIGNIQDVDGNTQDVDANFKEWISTSIDEFEKQGDKKTSLKQILANNKFYDKTTMAPTLAGLGVLETNKNKIQEFMVKNNITVEDLESEQNQQNKQEEHNKKQTEKENDVEKNPISSANTLMQNSDMQKNEKYKKDEAQGNNLKSNISLQTLNDLQTQR